MTDTYDPPLVHLPGTKLTPDVVLHRTLNKIDHIQAVAVVILWNDGSYDVDWSVMRTSSLCMAAMIFSETAGGVATGRSDAIIAAGEPGGEP